MIQAAVTEGQEQGGTRSISPDPADNHLRATHVWFGPDSPLTDQKQAEEHIYRHIFFPQEL